MTEYTLKINGQTYVGDVAYAVYMSHKRILELEKLNKKLKKKLKKKSYDRNTQRNETVLS